MNDEALKVAPPADATKERPSEERPSEVVRVDVKTSVRVNRIEVSNFELDSIRRLAGTVGELLSNIEKMGTALRLFELIGRALMLVSSDERSEAEVKRLTADLKRFIGDDPKSKAPVAGAVSAEAAILDTSALTDECAPETKVINVRWLRTRVRNAISKTAGVETVGELARLMRENPKRFDEVKGFGEASLRDVLRELGKRNLL